MLSCKEASHLASKGMDVKLSWRERLGLMLHLSMCSVCRRYLGDLKKMRLLMSRLGRREDALLPESQKLSDQSRERIKQALTKEDSHSSGDSRNK